MESALGRLHRDRTVGEDEGEMRMSSHSSAAAAQPKQVRSCKIEDRCKGPKSIHLPTYRGAKYKDNQVRSEHAPTYQRDDLYKPKEVAVRYPYYTPLPRYPCYARPVTPIHAPRPICVKIAKTRVLAKIDGAGAKIDAERLLTIK